MAVGTDTVGTGADLSKSPTPGAGEQDGKRWWVLAILGIAQLMVVLDSTIVNIALPSAQTGLGFDNADRQWVVTGYALAFGSLLLIGGRLADFFGRKWALLVGLVGFAVASAVGGAAVNFAMLVSARAVQGAFGALLAPATLALLTTTFSDPKERGKAFGIFGGIAGGGASLGLLLGGFLTEYASWRWTLYVNLVFAAIAFIGALSLLPRHERSEDRQGADIPGTFSITVGLFALVYGFSNADQHGWGAGLTVGCLIVAAVLLAAFVVIETRVSNPILPMRVVVDRNRGGAFLVMFLAGIGMFAVFLFLTYYLQGILQYSAVKSGVAFLPMTGTIVVVAGVGSAVLVTKISSRIMIPFGMLLAAAGLYWLTHIDLTGNYASVVLPSTIVMGLGLGLVFAPGFNLAVLGVQDDDAGVASASVNVMQQVGGSVGTSLFNTIAASVVTTYLASHLVGLKPNSVAYKVAEANSQIHSYTVAFWIASAIFLAGAVISALVLRSGIAQAPEGDAPIAV
ncbi:DHA2 family efflux MFS transporter permease subunit [Jatrophihabitans endophyticus]|uniref:DHA2 family efflux MFS transporter permease subunit n=1 Tax=Jatrophihabitans endophyticus TaxID=1206085 RepID=UPI001A0F3A9A|nr:DHA2 family efflux MFS transporter permease subunit [Jatrophihabitans endophyticus]MBE7187024.1 DHA2 family efflux MFS transporter permease subunit [Jatrophihabitans endophyticus]